MTEKEGIRKDRFNWDEGDIVIHKPETKPDESKKEDKKKD